MSTPIAILLANLSFLVGGISFAFSEAQHCADAAISDAPPTWWLNALTKARARKEIAERKRNPR